MAVGRHTKKIVTCLTPIIALLRAGLQLHPSLVREGFIVLNQAQLVLAATAFTDGCSRNSATEHTHTRLLSMPSQGSFCATGSDTPEIDGRGAPN